VLIFFLFAIERSLLCITDAECKNAVCPPDKLHILKARSGGLYLEISNSGSKRTDMLKRWADYLDELVGGEVQ
jgi:hypothetical protein